jgi:hypothetical protein
MKQFAFPIFLAVLLACSGNLLAQSNQYLHFDKNDDYVEVPNGSQYVANANAITMAGWFYHDALGYGQGLMSIRGGGTGVGEMYLIQLNNGELECRFNTGTLYEVKAPPFTIVPQQWQHVAWVYTGTKVQLYIDGLLIGERNATGKILSTNRPFSIGKCLLGGFNFIFGGRADEVGLWSKALTKTEIEALMMNEPTGTEPGLELYYKFNQGNPGGDNTAISKLRSETGSGTRDGNLLNFAMTGSTSNFLGTLNTSFQAISFPGIGPKLISAPPITLDATSTAGLPVSYTLVSGPATLNGNICTLTGQSGTVTIKASQPGNGTVNAAADVTVSFPVLDPATFTPDVDARNPLAGDVFMPTLRAINLATITTIDHDPLFKVDKVEFDVNGTIIPAKHWIDGHYTAWWTPSAYGNQTIQIKSYNNYGYATTKTVNINVVNTAANTTRKGTDKAWVSVNTPSLVVETELPSYVGAYNKIEGNLVIECPTGGCDPWDRVSSIDVKGHNGEWIEIIRYITPYGVACNKHNIDLTDFMSILQGKVTFRVNLGTLGNGFLYTLNLNYTAGQPTYPYSAITKVWNATYDFGNISNLKPVPQRNISILPNTKAGKLKLVSTGHGWGDLNTGNAAEFHDDTHHVWVNGTQTFTQRNWDVCNPNPDQCSPQNGTWFHNRAGWCPGAIAQFFDYDMTPYINAADVKLDYIFDEDYKDFCHPGNPNCVTGVTCSNCADGFNPHLIVASYLISNSDLPLEAAITGINDFAQPLDFEVYPNPTSGLVNVQLGEASPNTEVTVLNQLGQVVYRNTDTGARDFFSLSLAGLPHGTYLVKVQNSNGVGVQVVLFQ